MAALFGARGLVFDVDPGRTALDEEPGELQHGRQAAMTGVGIGDDGAQIVDVGLGGALGQGG